MVVQSTLVTDFLQYLIFGIITGTILALPSLGLTLTYGILKFPNIAFGDYATFGAYMAVLVNISLGQSIWLGIAAAALGTMLVGVLADIFAFKPLRKKGATALFVISIGVSQVIHNGINAIWGGDIQLYRLPMENVLTFFGLHIVLHQILEATAAIALMFLTHCMLKYTRVGKAMRATADNADLSRVAGINTERIILYTWLLASAITGVSGVLLGLDSSITPLSGWNILLPIYAAVVIGGIGNPAGAIAGAMIVGCSQEVSVLAFGAEHASYKLIAPYAIMIIVLILKPQGLFGEKKRI